jgi:glutamate racemase
LFDVKSKSNPQKVNKLAIFDSGFGGLSVYKEIKLINPNLGVIYFADSKNVPYGNLSRERIFFLTKMAISELKDLGATSIAIACHTISTTILPLIKKSETIPIYDVASFSIEVLQKYNKISLIGTKATINSEFYQKKLGAKIVSAKPCPELVDMIESGNLDNCLIESTLASVEKDVDALFLACTHFPLIKDKISPHFKGVEIIDPANYFAEKLKTLSCEMQDEFYTTGDPVQFQHHAQIFLREQKVPSPFLLKSLYSPLI